MQKGERRSGPTGYQTSDLSAIHQMYHHIEDLKKQNSSCTTSMYHLQHQHVVDQVMIQQLLRQSGEDKLQIQTLQNLHMVHSAMTKVQQEQHKTDAVQIKKLHSMNELLHCATTTAAGTDAANLLDVQKMLKQILTQL